jgi:hypothetical protein
MINYELVILLFELLDDEKKSKNKKKFVGTVKGQSV